MGYGSQSERYQLAPAFSVYLDLLRGGSALWVALSHLHLFRIAGPSNILPLPEDGHDAVLLFFILSGFLVGHAVLRKPDQGLVSYALDRASRIYSVALPLLLLSFACAGLGLISAVPDYQFRHWYLYIPLFAAFLNQSLGYSETPMLLYPWWSLAFEVWYYVLFGCAFFLRGHWRWSVCALVFVLMGGRLWLLMPIWLGGVIALLLPWQNWPRGLALFTAIASVLLIITFRQSDFYLYIRTITVAPWGGPAIRPFGNATYFSTDYITLPLAVLHLVAMRRLLQTRKIPFTGSIKALAGVSFSLYLLHPLVYRIWTDGLHRQNGNTAETLLVLTVTLALAFALAPFTEYRRHRWRTALAKLLAKFGIREKSGQT